MAQYLVCAIHGVPPSATDIGNYLGYLKTHVDSDYGNQMSVDNEITELEGIDLNSQRELERSSLTRHSA